MDTITIPRDHYFSRNDDEGREYVGFATVKYAANKWAEDRPQHSWAASEAQEPVIAFTYPGDDRVELCLVTPDDDMEDLYLATDLPFAVVRSDFAAGDTVYHRGTPDTARKVIEVMRDGTVQIEHDHGGTTVIPGNLSHTPATTPTPAAPTGTPTPATRTIVVTVPDDMDATEARVISELFLQNTRRHRIVVREAR